MDSKTLRKILDAAKKEFKELPVWLQDAYNSKKEKQRHKKGRKV